MEMKGIPGENPATWVSKYGMVGILPYDLVRASLQSLPKSLDPRTSGMPLEIGINDGMNEVGLAAHALVLASSKYGKRDASTPGLSILMWLHYILGNFDTVKDAVAGLETIQLTSFGENDVPLHLAMEDPTGDSAVIEVIAGKMVVYQGREHRVMTNDPPYSDQLAHLERYRSSGSAPSIPGGVEPSDRFVRAAVFLETLPDPKDNAEAVSYLYSVIRAVSVPFGAVYRSLPEAETYPTWWVSILDLTNRIYFFNDTHSLNVIRVDLKALDFSAGRPPQFFDPGRTDITGDVTERFLSTP
jgi:choloylglycine hydrolase